MASGGNPDRFPLRLLKKLMSSESTSSVTSDPDVVAENGDVDHTNGDVDHENDHVVHENGDVNDFETSAGSNTNETGERNTVLQNVNENRVDRAKTNESDIDDTKTYESNVQINKTKVDNENNNEFVNKRRQRRKQRAVEFEESVKNPDDILHNNKNTPDESRTNRVKTRDKNINVDPVCDMPTTTQMSKNNNNNVNCVEIKKVSNEVSNIEPVDYSRNVQNNQSNHRDSQRDQIPNQRHKDSNQHNDDVIYNQTNRSENPEYQSNHHRHRLHRDRDDVISNQSNHSEPSDDQSNQRRRRHRPNSGKSRNERPNSATKKSARHPSHARYYLDENDQHSNEKHERDSRERNSNEPPNHQQSDNTDVHQNTNGRFEMYRSDRERKEKRRGGSRYTAMNGDDGTTLDDISSTSSSQTGGSRRRRRYKLVIEQDGVDILERKYEELQRLTDEVFNDRQADLLSQHAHQTQLLYRQYRDLTNVGESSIGGLTVNGGQGGRRAHSASRSPGNASIDRTRTHAPATQQSTTPLFTRPKSAFANIPSNQRLTASLTIQNRSRSADKNIGRETRSLSAESSPRGACDPTDHQLKNTKNDKIAAWLKVKNIENRRKLKEERAKKRSEYQERILAANEKLERRIESQKVVKDWIHQKRKAKIQHQREAKAKVLSPADGQQDSKAFIMLANSQGSKVCDQGGREVKDVRFPPSPVAKNSDAIKRIMHGYRQRKSEPLPKTGIKASGKTLSSRPSSARGMVEETEHNDVRKSYNQWLVDKRKEEAVKNHERKQEAIQNILAPDDSPVTERPLSRSNSRPMSGRQNRSGFNTPEFVRTNSEMSVDSLNSSLTRDDIIDASKVNTNKQKMKKKRSKKKQDRPEFDVFDRPVPFPPSEGCPSHVAKVQERLFSQEVLQSDRPEPQGSDGYHRTNQNADTVTDSTEQTSQSGNNSSDGRPTTLPLADSDLEENNKQTFVNPLAEQRVSTPDVLASNLDPTDQMTVVETYDLERQKQIAEQLTQTLFQSHDDSHRQSETEDVTVHDDDIQYDIYNNVIGNNNGDENDIEQNITAQNTALNESFQSYVIQNDPENLTRRRSVDKHVVFSEDAPMVQEYEPTELENEPDYFDTIAHLDSMPDDEVADYVEEILENIASENGYDDDEEDGLTRWESEESLDATSEATSMPFASYETVKPTTTVKTVAIVSNGAVSSDEIVEVVSTESEQLRITGANGDVAGQRDDISGSQCGVVEQDNSIEDENLDVVGREIYNYEQQLFQDAVKIEGRAMEMKKHGNRRVYTDELTIVVISNQ